MKLSINLILRILRILNKLIEISQKETDRQLSRALTLMLVEFQSSRNMNHKEQSDGIFSY